MLGFHIIYLGIETTPAHHYTETVTHPRASNPEVARFGPKGHFVTKEQQRILSKEPHIFFDERTTIFTGKNVHFIDKNVYFIDKNVYFIDKNVYFIDKNVHFIDKNVHFIDKNVYFIDKNVYFIAKNVYFTDKNVHFIDKNVYFIDKNCPFYTGTYYSSIQDFWPNLACRQKCPFYRQTSEESQKIFFSHGTTKFLSFLRDNMPFSISLYKTVIRCS